MTETNLVNQDVQNRWEAAHASGSDKRYPSIDLVRLERWHFEAKPGRLLEYGFGSGVNLIHMLERGYDVDAIDVAPSAKKNVSAKLANRPDLAARCRLQIIPLQTKTLPFADATFDYVTCISVISLLGSREGASRLLAEFVRVLKPGGKVIIDVNDPVSDFARNMRSVGDDVYIHRDGGFEFPAWCPSADTFYELISHHLTIVEKGWTGHKYFGQEITEHIACCVKN